VTAAINGATRLYAIVGDPIAQVRSPQLYTERFAAAGMNAVMVPMHVFPDRFDETVAALQAIGNLDGIIVTVPYKVRGVRFAAKLGKTAARIGALNALRRESDGSWTGEMFDGLGFVRAAERKGVTLHGRRVALFGAGGAGSAIGCELAAAGVDSLEIIDPQRERAARLVQILGEAFPACRVATAEGVPNDVDMIVNASTVGMREGDGMPGDIGSLRPGTVVGDAVIAERPTALIHHAMGHDCTFVAGRDMLAGQADALMSFLSRS
jgi:shikimate dehydrogenase